MKAILMFHSLDLDGGVLSYEPDMFRFLLDSLARKEVPIVPLGELLKEETNTGVSLTFDDGMSSVAEVALPILNEHKAVSHLFLSSGAVGGSNRWPGQPNNAPSYRMVTWEDVANLGENGVLIEGHSHSHPDLRMLSDLEIKAELDRNDAAITDATGRRPQFFAYPYGYVDQRVEEIAAAQYDACLTTKLAYLEPNQKLSMLPRLDTYYLQSKVFAKDIFSPATRGYIAVRALLRRVGGVF